MAVDEKHAVKVPLSPQTRMDAPSLATAGGNKVELHEEQGIWDHDDVRLSDLRTKTESTDKEPPPAATINVPGMAAKVKWVGATLKMGWIMVVLGNVLLTNH